MRATWCTSMGLVAALCIAPAMAQSPQLIQLDFKANVRADGVPTDIQPDATLAPPLQAMVRKRVAAWRYRVGTWQGKPVPAEVSQRIMAEVLPVTSGGFALRIKEVTYPTVMLDRKGEYNGINRMPPVYPPELMRQGVVGVLVYAYRIDAAGKQRELELVHPQQPDRAFKLLDAAGRAAMARWTFQPTTVAGEQVDCRVLTPMSFSLDGKAMPTAPDMGAYRASHPDVCPAGPVLLTEVVDSML